MSILKRDIASIQAKEFDLIIVGGGIFGACAAWEAASRGLTTLLLEKGDFSHATSANHFKMVHGGIRYLQHGDIPRIRESCRERSALLRIAPHLVQPLPIFIPTYGHGVKGKLFLGIGLGIYDLITIGRNKGIIPERRIPWSKFISKKQALEYFPDLRVKSLTGGATFCDGQMYNPPRLAIAFLRSAAERGGDAANYVEVTDFISEGEKIVGVRAIDHLFGRKITIKGKCVLNTAGPWAHRLLARSGNQVKLKSPPTFSRDLAFVIRKKLPANLALAASTKSLDSDTLVDRGGRHLFLVPWRDYTLVGVWHLVFKKPPEEINVSDKELEEFVAEVNGAYPGLNIAISDICMINTGLTLFGEEGGQIEGEMSFGKRSRLIDHSKENNIDGLLTLIGVRATTARGKAEEALDKILDKLGKEKVKSISETKPIFGGDFESFENLVQETTTMLPPALNNEHATALVHNYGSRLQEVLKYAQDNKAWSKTIGNSTVLAAEIIHAIREEMAQKLADVVLRRTELGSGAAPSSAEIKKCAELMANELNWDSAKMQEEIEETTAFINRYPNN